MKPTIEIFQDAISRLQGRVQALNQPANLDGLIAQHFCTRYVPQDTNKWVVFEDLHKWLAKNDMLLDQAPYMAKLGCLIAHELSIGCVVSEEVILKFNASLDRLIQRTDIFSNSTSWIYQPSVVLGICMGIRAIKSETLKQWFINLASNSITHDRLSLFQKLVFLYSARLLGVSLTITLPASFADFSLLELGLAVWLANKGILSIDKPSWLEEANSEIIFHLSIERIEGIEDDFRYAILLDVALTYIIARSHLPTDDLLVKVLKGFEPAMERWQDDWFIKNEYQVQAILWLILRPYFDDIRYEENFPKLGRAGHRYDLGIPSLGKVVEVKYVRKKEDFQKIINEVGIDAAQINTQAQFQEIVVFAYDETCAIENHSWTRETLLKLSTVKDAIIVSAPSMIRNH